MYDIDKMPSSIDVGYTGETNVNSIEINMAPWVSKSPGGSPKILYMRPGESEASLATTTFEDNVLTWTITDDVLGTREGTGLFQVWFADTDEEEELRKLGMSVVVSMIIHLSIAGEGGNAFTVQLPWLKEIMDLKNIILGYDYEAEAWAVGQSGGVDVPATNPAYNNHAKHYSEEAAKWATGGTTGTPGAENNAKYYSEQADAAKVAAQLARTACEAEVARQLSEIISNPDSPPLDRTLSSNVSAAPADMVGDLKSALLQEMDDTLIVSYEPEYSVVSGGIRASDGGNQSYTTRARTQYIPVDTNAAYLVRLLDSNYKFRVSALYTTNANTSFTRSDILKIDSYVIFKTNSNEHYFRTSFCKLDDTQEISEEEMATIKSALKIYKLTDETLTIANAPADSKAVGDRFTLFDELTFQTETIYGNSNLFQWKTGYYSASTGAHAGSPYYICSNIIEGKDLGSALSAVPPSGYAIRLYYWDETGAFGGYVGEHDSRSYPNNGFSVTINEKYRYAFDIGRAENETEQNTLLNNVGSIIFTEKRIKGKYKTIKILGIGNSYTRDSLRWVWKICKLLGYANVIVGHGYIGGITLQEQYESLDPNNSNHSSFQYWKYGLTQDATKTDGKTLDEIFTDEPWDYVIFQQQSDEAGQYSSFVNSDFDINDFASYVKTKIGNSSLKIGLSMTWSHSQGYTGTKFIEYYNGDPAVQLAAIKTVIPQVANYMTQCDFIVNPGRAVELGRGNTYLNAIGDEMLRSDKNHLAYGIPSFMAGLTYVVQITGLSIESIYWYPTAADEGVTSVTASEYLLFLAKQCVKNACLFIN